MSAQPPGQPAESAKGLGAPPKPCDVASNGSARSREEISIQLVRRLPEGKGVLAHLTAIAVGG